MRNYTEHTKNTNIILNLNIRGVNLALNRMPLIANKGKVLFRVRVTLTRKEPNWERERKVIKITTHAHIL